MVNNLSIEFSYDEELSEVLSPYRTLSGIDCYRHGIL
jgi:hypothetical protein